MSNFVPRTREINHGQRNQSYQSSACREERTNKWLAEQLGCAPTTLSKCCTIDCQPTMETVFKIAKLLEVELTELVRINKNQMKHPPLFELAGNYNTLSE